MKRARESSKEEQGQKVRRSSGASEASTGSKKRGRDFEVASSKKPSKSPKGKAAAEVVKDRSPSPQKQLSVEQQRLNAQNWAAEVVPSAKKTAAKKSEAKTPSSDKKVSEKKNSSKKTTVAAKKDSPAPSPSKNKTRTTRTYVHSSTITHLNLSSPSLF